MKVYLDYDATLVDLMSPWLSWLREALGLSLTCRDIPRFGAIEEAYGEGASRFFREDGVYEAIFPLPGAQEFVEDLKARFGKKNVVIISASFENHRREKEAHALRHFGVGSGDFLHSHEKHRHTGNGVLVDDHPRNVLSHIAENGARGILFTGGGEYGWTDIRNYDADPVVSRATREMDGTLLSVCGTYRGVLSVLEAERGTR